MSLRISLIVRLWAVIWIAKLLSLLYSEVEVLHSRHLQVAEVGLLEVALDFCNEEFQTDW